MAVKHYPVDYNKDVTLGGAPQNIRVRSCDGANPVLLFLHGGPGVCDRHWVLENQSDLAEVCTMVCWDQRGSGKSYNKEQANQAMSIDLIVNDGKELIDYLCAEFNCEKVYIVGHSWGSVLGVLLAQQYPQRIAAYIGMGQLINTVENEMLSYKFVCDEAKRRNDKKGIRELEQIGEPKNGSYGSLDNLIKQRQYMSKYGGGRYKGKETIMSALILPILRSPEYKLADIVSYANGSMYSLKQLWDEVTQRICFDETVKELEVPVYLTEGRHDQNTPPSIARRWFDQLKAPDKEWVWFEESAHAPIKEQPELWGKTVQSLLFER